MKNFKERQRDETQRLIKPNIINYSDETKRNLKSIKLLNKNQVE